MKISKFIMRVVSISFSALMFILIIYVLYQTGLKSYNYGYRVFTEPPVSSGEGRDKLVNITDDMDSSEIGKLLEEKGLIRDKWLFAIQLKLYGYEKKLLEGRYTLSTSMSARDMMKVMSGETQEESTDQT